VSQQIRVVSSGACLVDENLHSGAPIVKGRERCCVQHALDNANDGASAFAFSRPIRSFSTLRLNVRISRRVRNHRSGSFQTCTSPNPYGWCRVKLITRLVVAYSCASGTSEVGKLYEILFTHDEKLNLINRLKLHKSDVVFVNKMHYA
jgi:hypothetical protein